MNSPPLAALSLGSSRGDVLPLFLTAWEGEEERRLLSSGLRGAWPPTVTSGLSAERHHTLCVYILCPVDIYYTNVHVRIMLLYSVKYMF